MRRIHWSAIVDARAELADDVVVGPYAVIEGQAILASGCVLHAHALVRGPTVLGARCVIHPFAVIGGEPQATRHSFGTPARLEVGEGNVFREHVTVHGGTEGRTTSIGHANLFMVGAHVAHDVVIGSHCVLANGAQLAGHAAIDDWVTFGGLSGVAQFVRVGESAFVAASSACERSVPPFVVVQGDRARVRGLNVVGLRRRGVAKDHLDALRRAVRKLWMSRSPRASVLTRLAGEADPYVRRLVEWLTRQDDHAAEMRNRPRSTQAGAD
ncbi:MAG: acyl-ACP--UDP-N-acetylglucosamine O-acyltransferase [Myxococcota bacterium]|nr:acyl-ACP--UDP-N-acetylglucosamine O-acyltransferase [Myxococcota bacterium]